MIDVIDRIPTKPNEYIMEDLGGGRVRLTRADAPIVDGTPINRELFLSIAYDLSRKVVQFTQTQPTINKGAAAHTTTIWLSDSHEEKWNNVLIAQVAPANMQLIGLRTTPIELDLALACYRLGDSWRYYDLPVSGGVGTLTYETVVDVAGTSDDYYVTLQIIFDGYKVEVKQSYTGGPANTQNGGFFDVSILCRGRAE